MENSQPQKQIVVIKLSALGDFIQATGAFADIRAHHKNDYITLLTTKNFAKFAEKSGYFDAVKIDERQPFWKFWQMSDLFGWLQDVDMIYDLQGQSRTKWYQFFSGQQNWSGPIKGIYWPDRNPLRRHQHAFDMFQAQLRQCAVPATHSLDMRWAAEPVPADVEKDLKKAKGKKIGIIAGCSPQHPQKRWPHYAELIKKFQQDGCTVFLFGTDAEGEILDTLEKETGAANWKNKLNLPQTFGAMQQLDFVVGNDTGPLHMAAACHVPGLGVYNHSHGISDPVRHGARGPGMKILHSTGGWHGLDIETVWQAVQSHESYAKVSS